MYIYVYIYIYIYMYTHTSEREREGKLAPKGYQQKQSSINAEARLYKAHARASSTLWG